MKRILVCIITFRRAQSLANLLLELAKQDTEGFEASILIVDNDPQRSAEPVYKHESAHGSLTLRYVAEETPGIVAARNRCVSEFLKTGAEYLAFIDDDEWPAESSWLKTMLSVAQAHRADIVAGDVVSSPGIGTPEWATRILYEKSNRRSGDPTPVFYTGNVLIARPVLAALEPAFDNRFALTGASDYHFSLRCKTSGFRAVFAEALVIEEFPAERAKMMWFVRRGFRSGSGYTKSHLLEEGILPTVLRSSGLAVLRILRGAFTTAVGVVRMDRSLLVTGLFRGAAGFGTLAGLAGLNYREYKKLHDH